MGSLYAKKETKILYFSYYTKDGHRKAFPLYHPGTGAKLRDNPHDWIIANRLKKEIESDLDTNNKQLTWNIKLSTAIDKFNSGKENLSKKSRDIYKTLTNKVTQYLGDILVADITEEQIKEMVNTWGTKFSPNTVYTYEKYLVFFLKWLQEEKYITFSYSPRFKYKPARIRTIPEEDFNIILDYIKEDNTEMYRFYKILWLTGRRLGEIHRMMWEDILWNQKILYIRNHKGKREDQYPLFKGLSDFLKSFKEESGKLFSYSYDYHQHYWRKIINRLNKERETDGKKPIPAYTVHEIRKTVATNFRIKGIQLEDAADILGHKDISTTRKYYTAVKLDRLREQLEW